MFLLELIHSQLDFFFSFYIYLLITLFSSLSIESQKKEGIEQSRAIIIPKKKSFYFEMNTSLCSPRDEKKAIYILEIFT